MKFRILLSLIFFTCSFSIINGQDVQINLMVNPPYSHALESYIEYEDRMVVSIENRTEEVLSLRFELTITGDNGVSVRTRPDYRPAVPFIIEENEMASFTGQELEDIGISIDDSDLILVGLTTDMLNQRILPEGFYEICLQAFDFFTDAPRSAEAPLGCANLNIEYPSAPEIMIPETDWVMPEEESDLNISWQGPIITNTELNDRAEYRIRLIDMSNIPGINAEEAFSSAATIYEFDETSDIPFSFLMQDVEWRTEHQYALRVTAFDPDEEYQFLNNGNSNIIMFHYGVVPVSTTCDNPSDYEIHAHFPLSGDTLPFMEMPIVGEFSPHCDAYWRLDFASTASTGDTESRQLPWPNGALEYIRQCIYLDATWPEAALMPFDDLSGLTRSQSYSWSATTTMNTRVSGSWNDDISTTSFVVGMPRPRLQVPAHLDTVLPGDVHFQFRSGGNQNKILPDFKLSHVVDCNPTETRISDVHEKWVLQVFSEETPSASNLVQTHNAFLDVDIDALYNSANRAYDATQMNALLLRQLNHAFNFTEEGDYWWQVVWLRNPDMAVTGYVNPSDIYHESGLRKFVISNDAPSIVPTEPDTACSSPCVFPTITDRTAVGGLAVGGTFKLAGFDVEIESLTSGSSSTYAGVGLVTIAYLNNIKVRMNIENVQMNAAHEAFAGRLTPILDQSYPLSQVTTPLGTALGMDQTAAEALDAGLTGASKLLSLMSEGSTVNLPIGIDKTIDGNRIIVGIMDLNIEPDDAKMKAVVNLTLPNFEIIEGFVSLGAEVCMTASGFANEAKLYLPQDQVFDMDNGNEFRIAGAEGGRAEADITYVEWDCKGFKELNLSSIFQFTRDWILPENADGTVRDEGNVQARVRGKFSRGANIMVRMDMDPFQLPGVDGWSFTVAENAWIDLSDLENPTGLQAALPEDYTHASMESETMRKTWKGFWLQEVSVASPVELQGPDHDRLRFAIRDMIIDNSGLSLDVRAENILHWEENGSMSGWKVSLDAFFLEIAQNNFRAAGLEGKLGLPIADSTQFLNYTAALQHRADSFKFVFNVQPAENITIPISMAQATIERTSYIKVELGHRSFIEANITGSLSISDSNLSEGNSMPSSINMPGLRIQNLRLNSETGFDNSAFSYALASPQKSMSDFPISLEHFSLANDGVRIQPRLTLSEGNDSFAADARIVLNVDLDLFSSPQRFELTGVTLERISIDVTTSDVSLNGYLDFYKEPTQEGVRGGILIGLNMGRKIEISINADFGTYKTAAATIYGERDWYSYFYVDGMAVFGGITIFSGIDLYGLGGGFYHHMRMTNDLPGSTSVAGGSSGAASGVRYEPHFDTDLGLKFTAILGSTGDNGKAYNIDVTIAAEFSFAHGMTYLGLKGSFRVMSDGISVASIGQPGSNCPIAGYVELNLNMPPGAEATFDGQFFVKVKLIPALPLLRGIGTIPNPPPGWTADNAMIWANFYAGPDKWFFHCGSPTNRGGLSLELGGIQVAEITGYMMVGHDIPVLMPEPHAEFVRIFNQGRANPDQAVDGGNVDHLLSGQPRPEPSPIDGTGFAFGVSMMLNLDLSFFPFYFDLTAVIGADINVTEAVGRTCAGNSRVPGADGWYGMGQMYAAIEGDFGVRVDLFFIKGEFSILRASAALLLQGGMPNPEWARGRGSFYYEILGGLIDGRCGFDLEVGEVCMPVTTGNPFGDLEIIQDLTPRDGDRDVSIFVSPQAAFAIPMDRVLEIPEYVSSMDPPVIRYLKPYVHKFEVRLANSSSAISANTKFSEENRISELLTNQALSPNTPYKVEVEVRAVDLIAPSMREEPVMVDGSVYKENRTNRFTTGDAPPTLVDENIYFTYPYIKQQNFLKGETDNNKGYVRLVQGRGDLLGTDGEFEENEISFIARFTPEDGEPIEVPFDVSDWYRLLTFDVSQLENNKIYCVQFIRKEVPPETNDGLAHYQLDPSIAQNGTTNPALLAAIQNVQFQNFAAYIGASTVQSGTIRRVNLPAEKVNEFEKEIYHYYFRTSGFNTMKEKMAAGGNWDLKKISFLGFDLPNVEKAVEERLEWTDLQWFKVVPSDRAKWFDKRVGFYLKSPIADEFDDLGSRPIPENSYLKYRMQPNMYTAAGELHRIANRTAGAPQNILLSSQIARNVPYAPSANYVKRVKFSTNTPFKHALSESAIQNAYTEIIQTNAPVSSGLMSVGAAGISTGMNIFSGGVSPLLVSGFSLHLAPTPSRVHYQVHLTGWEHMQQWQRRVSAYAFRDLRYLFVPQGKIIDKMSPHDRSWTLNFLARNPINSMRLNHGHHYFGAYYKYPSSSGADRKGTMYNMHFYH